MKKFKNINHVELSEKILIVDFALYQFFSFRLQKYLGEEIFQFMSKKMKSLLKDIKEINLLLQTLLNRSCVQFYIAFKMVRCGYEGDAENGNYSIFKFSDEATLKLIENIT